MAKTPRPRESSTSEQPPERRRGGQELPDELQDRPEQNAGYDEAVRTGPPLERDETKGFVVQDAGEDDRAEDEVPLDADDLAERDAIAEVRKRERRE